MDSLMCALPTRRCSPYSLLLTYVLFTFLRPKPLTIRIAHGSDIWSRGAGCQSYTQSIQQPSLAEQLKPYYHWAPATAEPDCDFEIGRFARSFAFSHLLCDRHWTCFV